MYASSVCGADILTMRWEKRDFTLFSSRLIVSTRDVTPTTASPLDTDPVRMLCAVSNRQYNRACRA